MTTVPTPDPHPAVTAAAEALAAAADRDDRDDLYRDQIDYIVGYPDAMAAVVVPAVLRWAASVLPAYERTPVAVRSRLNELADEIDGANGTEPAAAASPDPAGTPYPAVPAHWTRRCGSDTCTGHPNGDTE